MLETRQQIDLHGQLRQDDTVVPFQLDQDGPLIRYSFTDPEKTLQLRLAKTVRGSTGDRNRHGKSLPRRSSTKKSAAPVSPTKISRLKFLYWPNARVLGRENIRTREVAGNCNCARPTRESQYANIFLWVDKKSGALMRMEGYERERPDDSKRFEVVAAQKIDNRWFLKQMRIEELQPGTNKVQSRTYLEIKESNGRSAGRGRESVESAGV